MLSKLLKWGPCNYRNQELEILNEMAQNYSLFVFLIDLKFLNSLFVYHSTNLYSLLSHVRLLFFLLLTLTNSTISGICTDIFIPLCFWSTPICVDVHMSQVIRCVWLTDGLFYTEFLNFIIRLQQYIEVHLQSLCLCNSWIHLLSSQQDGIFQVNFFRKKNNHELKSGTKVTDK